MLRIATSCLILILGSAARAVVAPELLQATAPWKIDYADASCVLTRPFSSPGQTHSFSLTFEPLEPQVWLRLANSEKPSRRDDGDAAIDVDGVPLGKPIHFNFIADKNGQVVREFWFRDFRNDLARAQKSIRFRMPRHGDVTVDIADFPKAMQAANECLADLYQSLGIDPALLKTIAIQPNGDIWRYLKLPEFKDEFNLVLLYWIDPQGRIDDCRLITPSGHKAFDESVCAILKEKAKFTSARNADGATIRAPVYENATIRRAVVSD